MTKQELIKVKKEVHDAIWEPGSTVFTMWESEPKNNYWRTMAEQIINDNLDDVFTPKNKRRKI